MLSKHLVDYQLKFKNMKRNIVAVGMLLAFSAALWSCSSSDDKVQDQDKTLEQSFTAETQTLADAVVEITSSQGFGLITMDETIKEGNGEESDDRFSIDHSITLEDIKGVYDYILPTQEEATETKMWYWDTAFERVDDSELFVINLPQEKAKNPWYLYEDMDGESEFDNDFNITASQYNLSTVMSNEGFEFDYYLDADITIEEEAAGDIFVDWNMSMSGESMSWEYASEFGLPIGYSVGHEFLFGEMIEFAYNLKKEGVVLFMEEVEYTPGNGENEAQYEYALTIGNIKIVKNSSSDDYMVYRDGNLEENAVIEIIDDSTKEDDGEGDDESDNAFCRGGFDIKITFTNDDGTEDVVILSELIGEDTLEQLDEIFSSMHDMYFVRKLVDRVAKEAYRMNMQQDGGE